MYCCIATQNCQSSRMKVSIFALSNRVLLLSSSGLTFVATTCFNIRSVESCTAARCHRLRLFVIHNVSIFALSNRVLLQRDLCMPPHAAGVSIFALSNRVLLPARNAAVTAMSSVFQYSLCRIVYCCRGSMNEWRLLAWCFNIRSVESCTAAEWIRHYRCEQLLFQYSLCRIVYCCYCNFVNTGVRMTVSIFALSNRVLLLSSHTPIANAPNRFQYSLCRIVYCCDDSGRRRGLCGVVSIFALSNRVLLHGKRTILVLVPKCFNIRSVESCTAAGEHYRQWLAERGRFNIRSVESCTAAFLRTLQRMV